jgi:asparagine synthase (glutamine-hydrolysing)
MCGICGFTGPADPELLGRMIDVMRHRGPDGEGSYASPSGLINLGHRRLSIIDLSGGAQPMRSGDGRYSVSFNGEIYNYKELNEELRAGGVNPRTTSDTETLLHLYGLHGVDMLTKLNGMFAFALWDEQERTLLLARDRLGVKPLYWTRAAGRLLFASEIKSLLQAPGVDTGISERALSLYLSLRNVPEPETIYRGVFALPPAHFMLVRSDGQARTQRYWSLDFSNPRPESEEDALTDELEALLLDATRLRMRADVPVGAFLSGGVDSSLVVAMARKISPGHLHTFSLAFADKPEGKNDPYYARLLSRLYETEHHEYTMPPAELGQKLDELSRALEQPFAGVCSTYFLTRLVRQHVKVALTGDGADDQFASYGHHRLVWPLTRLAAARAAGAVDPYAVADLSPLAGRPEFVRQFDGMDIWQMRAQYGAFGDAEKERVLSERFRGWVREHSVADFYARYWRKGTARDPLNAMLEVDIQTLLPNEILFFCDRLSMAHSVELRSPFLDYRVAEFAATISGGLKIKGGTLKYILKKVASRYVPEEIITRPKEGFVLPNHVWLNSGLNEILNRRLAPERLARHGYFDAERVRQLIAEHHRGVRDHTFRILSILMFQVWHDMRSGNA